MAASRAMRRLLRILEIQEDQYRAALDATLGELRRLEESLSGAMEQERRGREFVRFSATTGELADRLAGLQESQAAHRHAATLKPRIAESEAEVNERRKEFLLKRVERRKAETVIQKEETEDAVLESRRGQRGLDDWFLSTIRRDRNP